MEKESWDYACERAGVDLDLDPGKLQLVRGLVIICQCSQHSGSSLLQIHARASQMRGDVKTAARKHVAYHFGFSELAKLKKGPGDPALEAQQRCRERAVELLREGLPMGQPCTLPPFVYEVSCVFCVLTVLTEVLQDMAGNGLFKHPIFQDVINDTWFKHARDDGVVIPAYSDGASLNMLALVCTTVMPISLWPVTK